MMRIGKVNYHVVLSGDNKILHRHIDQLIRRVPKIETSEEVAQAVPESDHIQPRENEATLEQSQRRSNRTRITPAWTKDYQMKK